jgi:hypothetical protein
VGVFIEYLSKIGGIVKALIALVGIAFCLTGCSAKTSLGYTSVIEQQEKNGVEVKVGEFGDGRAEPQKIGAMKNMFGMTIVSVMTDDSVPEWVTKALAMELNQAGYSVVDHEDGYKIEGKVIEAFTNTAFVYEGSLSVDLSFKKGGEVVFRKIYSTDEDGGLNWMDRTVMTAKTLEINLQEICRQFIADINSKLVIRSDSL